MRERIVAALLLLASSAGAQPPTPGYSERVLQWTVKNAETCAEIAEALYGSSTHAALIERYNAVRCEPGVALTEGTTLVVPEKPTTLPTARLRSVAPDVRARAAGAAWEPAQAGMALHERYSVNTLEKARADIVFVDRTRVVLGEHTLVVIYDTAKRTDVARTIPNVELETGEVQAGLAALRGRPFEVQTQGGVVNGKSRETVVRAKADRATVSVLDGTTKVSSGGQTVDVPKHYGTSFRRSGVPTTPRALPVAPRWIDTSSRNSVIDASWEAVPNTASYRIEVARDADFVDLVLREEVPERVRAFRAEKLPAATYFMRVRAIDRDDFMGIASEPRSVVLAQTRFDPPKSNGRRTKLPSTEPRLGVTAPIVSPSPLDQADWWAPTRANGVVLETRGYLREERFGSMLGARASGSIGPMGLDTLVTTSELGGPAADGSAWFRLRWRATRAGTELELGPAADLALPLTSMSPPARAGIGFAIGGPHWLANLGGRAPLSENGDRLAAPDVQGYLLLGATYDFVEWLRGYALLDGHLLDHPARDSLAARGGLSVGAELGAPVFVGAALRASPWDDAGGTLIGQLSVGIRDR